MLKVTHLRKTFDTVVAVDGVSLEVQRGELFGLLGPNGAGKTTTIRTVLNVIKPDGGEITFDGKPFVPETWDIIGYLPEERGLYRKSKVISTILYFASLKGVNAAEARPQASKWLERFGLENRANDKVEELSKGNQQKVQIISALLHHPQLLILDEPFAGLDPVNQILLKDILMEVRQQNVAIVFSTHQMEQVEKMCDNICLINRGKPVLKGALRDIKQRYGKNSVHLEFDGDGSFIKDLPFVRRADIYQNYAEVEPVNPQQATEVLRHVDGKLSLRKFEIVEPSLNSIFIDVVGKPKDEAPVKSQIQKDGSAKITKPRRAFDWRLVVGVALPAVICVILVAVNLQKEEPNWSAPAILALIALFGAYRMLRARELSDKGTRSSGENNQ